MPEIEGVVIGKLLGTPAVAAVFGTRAEPDPLSQGRVLPAMTYKVVGKPHAVDVETTWVRLQVTVWADTYAQVQAGSTAIRKALQGYMGVVGGVTIIQATFLNLLDVQDPVTGKRTRPMDFQILFREE